MSKKQDCDVSDCGVFMVTDIHDENLSDIQKEALEKFPKLKSDMFFTDESNTNMLEYLNKSINSLQSIKYIHQKLSKQWSLIHKCREKMLREVEKKHEILMIGIQEERMRFQEEKNIYEDLISKTNNDLYYKEVIKLNVGGTIYTTSLKLLKNSWVGHTFLSAMFSSSWKKVTDNNGNYFIDRNGAPFIHIINLMRDPSYCRIIEKLESPQKAAFEIEAQYFGIFEQYISALNEYIDSPSQIGNNKFRINKRVKIYWDGDDKWYEGIIVAHRSFRKCGKEITKGISSMDRHEYKIKYDDGESKWVNLAKRKGPPPERKIGKGWKYI